MQVIFLALFCFISSIIAKNSTILDSPFPWLRLPATPQLPPPHKGQYLQRDGFKIWYTIYGSKNCASVLFLHGGLGNSDYWGNQVKALKSKYRCILMDLRGQGRSTLSSAGISYDLMASDAIALLDHLEIEKAHVVGWSVGAIISLNMAMKYPTRLSSLFSFAASYNPSGVKDFSTSPVALAYLQRAPIEYQLLNPAPNYTQLLNAILSMQTTSPNWVQADFAMIDQNLPVWIADGDHEEVIYREQPDTMSSWIPQSGELILPRTSHFAFLQIPDLFTMNLVRFLEEAECYNCSYTN